jgi:hypothetical protein
MRIVRAFNLLISAETVGRSFEHGFAVFRRFRSCRFDWGCCAIPASGTCATSPACGQSLVYVGTRWVLATNYLRSGIITIRVRSATLIAGDLLLTDRRSRSKYGAAREPASGMWSIRKATAARSARPLPRRMRSARPVRRSKRCQRAGHVLRPRRPLMMLPRSTNPI